MNKKAIILFFLLLLLPFVFLFLRSKDFFVLHDGIYHLQRTFDFLEAVSEGHFPVRWSTRLNNNFGSPIFIFLFPFPYIISSIFYLIFQNLVLAYKVSNIFFILVFIAGSYHFLKKVFTSSTSALFGAALAVFTPYYLVQIFVRGAFREMASMSLLPWVAYFLVILSQKKNIRSVIKFSAALSLCFLSDGLTLLTMLPFLSLFFGYLLIKQNEKRKLCLLFCLSIIFFLGICSFIIFPYIFESQYINPNLVFDFFRGHFVLLKNIFSLKWSFGFAEKWLPDRMPLQFGILQILVLVSAFVAAVKEKNRGIKALITAVLINIIFVTLIATENFFSVFIWEKISFVRILQFPWRFYSSLPLSFAMCGAYIFSKINKQKKINIITAILICLPLILSLKYLRTNQALVIDEKQIISRQGQESAFHEFIPKGRDTTSSFDNVQERFVVLSGKMDMRGYEQKSQTISFHVSVQKPGILQINHLSFPGWEIFDNGSKLENGIDYKITLINEKIRTKNDDSGLFRINLKSGSHFVFLNFRETPIRKIGDIISLVSMTLVFVLYIINLFKITKK